MFSFQLNLLFVFINSLLFIVTTSLCQDWVIYAPAAYLGCSGHFSCPFSGIKPSFSVTRYHHGCPLYYRPKLIGQKFDRFIIHFSIKRNIWFVLNIMIHLFFSLALYLIYTFIYSTNSLLHVLALDLPRLSMSELLHPPNKSLLI